MKQNKKTTNTKTDEIVKKIKKSIRQQTPILKDVSKSDILFLGMSSVFEYEAELDEYYKILTNRNISESQRIKLVCDRIKSYRS